MFHHKENRCVYCEIDERHILGLQEFVKKSKTKKQLIPWQTENIKKEKGKIQCREKKLLRAAASSPSAQLSPSINKCASHLKKHISSLKQDQ